MPTITTFTEEDAKVPYETYFGTIPADEVFNMKDCPYEDKLRFLRYIMAFDGLINAPLLTNISFLIYGKNIADETFAEESVIFTNLEEYVDAKYDLKTEIEEYARNLLKFYFAALKSYAVILPDGKIDIPASYKVVLIASDTSDISKLMNKFSFDTKDIPLVFDAGEVVDSFNALDSPVVKDFMNFVMESLKK